MKATLIDYKKGLLYCADSEEVYREIAAIFCEQYESVYEELNQCLQEGAWEDYTVKIHALKNNARNVGAELLGENCFALELAGKQITAGENSEERMEYIKKCHPDAMQLYSKTIEELQDYFYSK